MARQLVRALHLDHSGLPGGGQLGLKRFLRQGSGEVRNSALLLSGGPVADDMVAGGSPVRQLGSDEPTLWRMLRQRRVLARAIAEANPDVVVANSLRAAIALFLTPKRCRWVYYLRQDMSVGSMGFLRRVFVLHLVLRRFDGLIGNSDWTLKTVPEETRQRHVLSIAPPLSGAEDLLEIGVVVRPAGGPFRVGWMGRIVDWKGLHVLIDALDLLHESGLSVRLQVAGTAVHEADDYMQELVHSSRERPYIIEYLGHLDDVRGFLRNQDVLVHTSVRPEPFGQVIVQGMAASLPVIATNLGGPAEVIVDGQSGILVQAGDERELSVALKSLSDNPDERQRLGERARERVRAHFTDRASAESLNKALIKFAAVESPKRPGA